MKLEVLLNKNKVASLREFVNLENRYYNGSKPTVFVIQTGVDSEKEFLEEVEEADVRLADLDKMSKNWYYRGGPLEAYMDSEKKDRYTKLAEQWISHGKESVGNLKFQFENLLWKEAFCHALENVINEYRKQEPSEGKFRNFLILLFFRIDFYFPELFKNTKILSKFPKFVYTGVCNSNEYFFLKLLSLCGCDVYGLDPRKNLTLSENEISDHVQLVKKSRELGCKIPPYDIEKIRAERAKTERTISTTGTVAASPVIPENSGVKLKHSDRNKTSVFQNPRQESVLREQTAVDFNREHGGRRELSYEELARMAGSVVMIVVFNEQKEAYASGSGVLINNQGYVVTNFHVIQGAAAFGVRLEEEEELRFTNELIKYHPDIDLALIRIPPVNRPPIPIYRGENLVRGQKVVAIGSPLGLFNTVSDGIIAGFRNVDNESMIQFTAPSSSGSSGGALLNLYGELIGIVAAGYGDGQNLNLAVDYKDVQNFLRGFI